MVSKETAWKDINDLIDRGLIERKSSGAHTYYTLKTERYRSINKGRGLPFQVGLNERQKKALEYINKRERGDH